MPFGRTADLEEILTAVLMRQHGECACLKHTFLRQISRSGVKAQWSSCQP